MRINCIPVSILADQHLRAEWLEMLLLPHYIERSLKSKKGIVLDTSERFTLNKGHAWFFYNKIGYVLKRYEEIGAEMRARGYNTNPRLSFEHLNLPPEYFKDWAPTEEDQLINLERIEERISQKPNWYTYRSRKLGDWGIFYKHYKQLLTKGD